MAAVFRLPEAASSAGEQEKRQRREEDVLLFAAEVGQIVLLQHGFGIAVAVQVPAEDDAIPVAEALLPHQAGQSRAAANRISSYTVGASMSRRLSPAAGGHRLRPGKGPLQPGQGGGFGGVYLR